jgi:high-affinity iron transporter
LPLKLVSDPLELYCPKYGRFLGMLTGAIPPLGSTMSRSRRRGFAVAFSLACMILALPRLAWAEDDEAQLAARLEHKLAYLAADYAMAASSTAPGDEGESDEHAELADELARMVGRLALPRDLARQVVDVSMLVRRNASASEVGAAAFEARWILIASFRLPVAPSAAPDAARGRALFEQYCATCHGLTGRADTERAAALKPRPANYVDPSIGEPLSPYRITTTVRFGVDGTAMVPFGFLGEAERWDVAFYAMGLRHVASSVDEGRLHDVSELAILSDAELRADLRAGGVGEASVEPVLTGLRRRAPYEHWTRSDSLAVVRGELEEARGSVYRGERDVALAAALRAESSGLLPAEPAIRSVDPSLDRGVRNAFETVIGRIEGDAPAKDVHLAIVALLQSTLRAQRALWHAYGGRSPVSTAAQSAVLSLLGGAGALLLVVALLAILARGGLARENESVFESVHGGWALALPLGIVTSLLFSGARDIPSAARDATEGGLSLFVGCGLLYLGASLFSHRARTRESRPLHGLPGTNVALFAVTFAAIYRAAFMGCSLLRSLVACGVAARPAIAGASVGVIALGLLAAAYTGATRLVSPRAATGVSVGLLCAVDVLFLGQAVVVLHPW